MNSLFKNSLDVAQCVLHVLPSMLSKKEDNDRGMRLRHDTYIGDKCVENLVLYGLLKIVHLVLIFKP